MIYSIGTLYMLTMVQCIPESLTLKKDIFRDLDKILDADVIIASNSSSYTIADIMAGVTYNHPERMVSLHSCKYEMQNISTYHSL